jgi:hypothetical protein
MDNPLAVWASYTELKVPSSKKGLTWRCGLREGSNREFTAEAIETGLGTAVRAVQIGTTDESASNIGSVTSTSACYSIASSEVWQICQRGF